MTLRRILAALSLVLFAGLLATPAGAYNEKQLNSDTPLISLSAQAAATVNSPDQANPTGHCALFDINLTTVTTATVTVTIQGKDLASSAYFTILASAGLASTGNTLLTVCPGSATTTNVSTAIPLPRTFRVSVGVVGASASVTGTVGVSVLP